MATLDEELLQQQAEMNEQITDSESEPEKPKEIKDEVLIAFANLPNGPGPDQVDLWKANFGDVRVIAFETDEIYVYRTLRRLEWKKLLVDIKEGPSSDAFQEQVVKKCVLWPALDVAWSATSKAGTIPTLCDVVLENSNFLNPQVALSLVRKL